MKIKALFTSLLLSIAQAENQTNTTNDKSKDALKDLTNIMSSLFESHVASASDVSTLNAITENTGLKHASKIIEKAS